MAVKAHCDVCEKQVQPEAVPINNIFYLLLTFVSLGFGAILWVLAAMSSNEKYRCPICKATMTAARKEAYEAEREASKAKAKEVAAADKEHKKMHGLPWFWPPYRLVLLAFWSGVLIGLGQLEASNITGPIPWWVYLPLFPILILTLFGLDIMGIRETLRGDWEALLFSVTVWIVGVGGLGFLLDLFYRFLVSAS
jgi:hypothetical protein